MVKKEKTKGKGKGRFFIKILIVLLLLAAIGGGGYFGYKKFFANSNNKTATAASSEVKVVSDYTFGLDEILVNLSDEDSTRYIKIKVYIGYDKKKLGTELTEKAPILRDKVISVFRTKKAADFSSKGIEIIKSEILSKINPLLTKGQATNIYFYDILVQ